MSKVKKRFAGLSAKAAAATVAAALMVGIGSSAAEAAVYASYGEEQCPGGYDVFVRVELDSVGDVAYRRDGSNRTEYYSRYGWTHIYYYKPAIWGARVKWKVEASKGIRTVSDGCRNPAVARTTE